MKIEALEEWKAYLKGEADYEKGSHYERCKAKITLAALAHYEAMRVDENGLRYELGMGGYGAYFHDTKTGEDLKLEEVLALLNNTRPDPVLDAVTGILEGEKE